MKPVCKGPWTISEVATFLQSARMPLRIACMGSDAYPRVVSVWFEYEDGKLFCASHRDAALIRLLRKCARVGFEVSANEPPYYGVRGQADAQISDTGGGELLQQLIARYLGDTNADLSSWLLSRSDEELLIELTPVRYFSWDYRDRMEAVK